MPFHFNVAADGIGQRHAHWPAGQQIVHGIAKFVGSFRARLPRAVVHPPGVAEDPVVIESIVNYGIA